MAETSAPETIDSIDTFKTPAGQLEWDISKIESNNGEVAPGDDHEQTAVPTANPNANKATSLAITADFADIFNLDETRDSIAELLAKLASTALSAGAFVSERGVDGFIRKIEDLLRPLFYPIVVQRQGNLETTLTRDFPANGTKDLYLDIVANTTISYGAFNGGQWAVQTLISPTDGPPGSQVSTNRTKIGQLRTATVALLSPGGTETTTVTTNMVIVLPSVEETLPDIQKRIRRILADAGLIEPDKPSSDNLVPSDKPVKPPSTPANPEPEERSWLDTVKDVLGIFVDILKAAITDSIGRLKVVKVVVNFNSANLSPARKAAVISAYTTYAGKKYSVPATPPPFPPPEITINLPGVDSGAKPQTPSQPGAPVPAGQGAPTPKPTTMPGATPAPAGVPSEVPAATGGLGLALPSPSESLVITLPPVRIPINLTADFTEIRPGSPGLLSANGDVGESSLGAL